MVVTILHKAIPTILHQYRLYHQYREVVIVLNFYKFSYKWHSNSNNKPKYPQTAITELVTRFERMEKQTYQYHFGVSALLHDKEVGRYKEDSSAFGARKPKVTQRDPPDNLVRQS